MSQQINWNFSIVTALFFKFSVLFTRDANIKLIINKFLFNFRNKNKHNLYYLVSH
jgi:hypothetical protein